MNTKDVINLNETFEVYIIDRHTRDKIAAVAEPARRADTVGLKGRGWNFKWKELFTPNNIVYKDILDSVLQGLIAFHDDTDKGL